MLLEGLAVVVTGSSRGIGRAIAIAAAREGASVVINGTNREHVDAVVDEIHSEGGAAVPSYGSVANWESAAATVENCLRSFGAVHGFVNNAGLFYEKDFLDEAEESLRRVVEVNLLGTMYCGRHCMSVMAKQGHGSIVNVTSRSMMGRPKMGAYGATKGAIASLTFSWALDMREHGVRVNAISPAAETDANRGRYPPGVMPTPESNAPLALYLLSALSKDITGQVIDIRGRELSVFRHPAMTEDRVFDDEWSPQSIARAFNGSLHRHIQDVGAPDPNAHLRRDAK